MALRHILASSQLTRSSILVRGVSHSAQLVHCACTTHLRNRQSKSLLDLQRYTQQAGDVVLVCVGVDRLLNTRHYIQNSREHFIQKSH